MPFDKLKWQKEYDRERRDCARSKEWRASNPGYKGQYSKVRRSRDAAFRKLENARRRVRHALKGVGSVSERTRQLLGCTGFELRAMFEPQFKPEMTWDNFGIVWEIDHKIPCAQFNFNLPGQLEECFHFSNLQPLEAEKNRHKGVK